MKKNTRATVIGTTATGAAVALGGPSAALGIASFGTASTGVAIGTLHGAAASSAAMAWLGGGALTAGGGGMAAGAAVLAAIPVVGWTIAGAGLLYGLSRL